MSGRRKFAADIRDFQYSLYSTQERLYVKFSPDTPLVFGQKLPKGGLSGANRTDDYSSSSPTQKETRYQR